MAIGDRLVSETTGVATLVLFTVVVTASVGVGVLFVDEDQSEGPQADFSFEYESSADRLTVTHAGGDELDAGTIVFVGPRTNTTWAAAASWNESRTVGQGDIVRLSQQNAYGDRVRDGDTIEVVHVADDGNRTTLDSWNGTESGGF